MEGPIGRYARASEDYTGITNVANVLGTCVANTISASGLCPRKQAGHLIASDLVRKSATILTSGGPSTSAISTHHHKPSGHRALFRVVNRYVGNLAPMPACFRIIRARDPQHRRHAR